jgi:CheY-like chemotaxis protein
MSNSDDQVRAAAIISRIAVVKEELAVLMADHGLREKDGWRVAEEIRQKPHGTDFVYRPIHMKLAAPPLERVVSIDNEGNPLL